MLKDRAGAMMWVAGCVVMGTSAVYVWLLEDPMLVYLVVVSAAAALFPAYKTVIACTGILGAYRIAVRHDTVTGGFGSFVKSVAEGLDVTVGGLGSFVMAMAILSLARALLSFTPSAIYAAAMGALPITGIMAARRVIESAADADMFYVAELATSYVKGMAGSFKALLLQRYR